MLAAIRDVMCALELGGVKPVHVRVHDEWPATPGEAGFTAKVLVGCREAVVESQYSDSAWAVGLWVNGEQFVELEAKRQIEYPSDPDSWGAALRGLLAAPRVVRYFEFGLARLIMDLRAALARGLWPFGNPYGMSPVRGDLPFDMSVPGRCSITVDISAGFGTTRAAVAGHMDLSDADGIMGFDLYADDPDEVAAMVIGPLRALLSAAASTATPPPREPTQRTAQAIQSWTDSIDRERAEAQRAAVKAASKAPRKWPRGNGR